MQTPDTNVNLLDAKRHELIERRETLIHQLGQAARCLEDDLARQKLEHVERANEFIATLDGLAREAREARERRRYVVSSLFLHESFKKLTADQDEQFFFVTGTEIGGALVLDQWAEFAHQKRSMMGVTAEPNGIAKRKDLGDEGRFRKFQLRAIKERGYKLDVTWLKDESLEENGDLPDPQDLASEAITELEAVVDDLREIMDLLEKEAVEK